MLADEEAGDLETGGGVETAEGKSVSEADREKWEARYAQQKETADGSVDPFLEEIVSELPLRGRALDVAGGAGRNAIFLARRGLDVTVVDISDRGLGLARAAAFEEGFLIATRALDLDRDPLPEGPFSVVVCTWFLLRTAYWRAITRVLAPGGLVVYVQPTLDHAKRHDHPSRRFLDNFSKLGPTLRDVGVEPLRLEEGWDVRGNHTARLLGRLR